MPSVQYSVPDREAVIGNGCSECQSEKGLTAPMPPTHLVINGDCSSATCVFHLAATIREIEAENDSTYWDMPLLVLPLKED